MSTEITSEFVWHNIPPRPRDSHKGSFGTVLAVAGSAYYRGAALLAAEGALRTGAGIVTLASVEPVLAAAVARLPECCLCPCVAGAEGGISPESIPQLQRQKATVLLLGPGLGGTAQSTGRAAETRTLVQKLLPGFAGSAVLDADGLNAAAQLLAEGKTLPHPAGELIVTPHPGEMARLTGLSAAEINADREEIARQYAKKWNAVVPASLVSIILTTAFSIFMGLDVPVVGTIPQTLFPEKRLVFSALDLSTITNLIMPAFSIAILGMIESLLCGASAGQMTGVRLKSNQELIAQGVGNILLPFFGGIPATAAIARTSVAIRSGAKTRLTGMFHAVGLLISMFLLAPVMSQIPMAALAGVLMVTAWRMNEWNSILYMFSHKFKGAMLEFLATMVATIVFDLTIAILVGVVIGLIFLVSRLSFIEINYEKVDMDRLHVTDPALLNRYNNAMVAYITGPMIFANTQNVADISTKIGDCDTLLLSMRGVSNIDISCAQTLRTLIGNLRMKGVDVVLCGLPSRAMEMMRRTDLDEYVGKENFYWSVERALLTNRPLPPCRQD